MSPAPEPASPFTLREYRGLLQALLQCGYQFVSYAEARAAAGPQPSSQKLCVLRHDCDYAPVNNLAMARLEAELGISTGYFVMLGSPMYNLLAPEFRALFVEILQLGHQLGLHFDERRYPGLSGPELGQAISREAELLGRELGQEVDMVSFHIPSREVLENRVQCPFFHTYDWKALQGFKYLSDSSMNWREGAILPKIQSGEYDRLHLLVHSEWWQEEPGDATERWARMLAGNLNIVQGSLLHHEPTYRARQWQFPLQEAP